MLTTGASVLYYLRIIEYYYDFRRSGGMADTVDSKPTAMSVRVQIPHFDNHNPFIIHEFDKIVYSPYSY